ncbi:ABC transporter permease subunit [Streptomyces parvus]|uniref:ABC transporter permease subunit n=1 Tax=Streptomyces parvus TaxID=66428 RepID=UPI0036878DF9
MGRARSSACGSPCADHAREQGLPASQAPHSHSPDSVGWTDRLLNILNDWFLVLPMIPVTVLAASLLGNRAADLPLGRTSVLIVVIGLFGWAGTSRIVRAEVLSLKHRAFVERSVVLGAGRLRVIRTQILPNVMPLVLANAVVYVALAILVGVLAYVQSRVRMNVQSKETCEARASWFEMMERCLFAISIRLAGPRSSMAPTPRSAAWCVWRAGTRRPGRPWSSIPSVVPCVR